MGDWIVMSAFMLGGIIGYVLGCVMTAQSKIQNDSDYAKDDSPNVMGLLKQSQNTS